MADRRTRSKRHARAPNVHYATVQSVTLTPFSKGGMLRLRGLWVQRIFPVGTRVRVETNNGTLIISKTTDDSKQTFHTRAEHSGLLGAPR